MSARLSSVEIFARAAVCVVLEDLEHRVTLGARLRQVLADSCGAEVAEQFATTFRTILIERVEK